MNPEDRLIPIAFTAERRAKNSAIPAQLRRFLSVAILAATIGILAGCSGLEARKVSLDKRLAGADRHVDGFRYYLSRPYLVVPDPIPVAVETRVATLVRFDDAHSPPRFLAASVGLQGQREMFDLQGHLLPDTDPAQQPNVKLEAADLNAMATTQRVAVPDPTKDPKADPTKDPKNDPSKNDPSKKNTPLVPPPPLNPVPAVPSPPEVLPPPAVAPPMPPINEQGGKNGPSNITPDVPGSNIKTMDLQNTLTRTGMVGVFAQETTTTKVRDDTTSGAGPAFEKLKIVYLPDFEEQMAVKHCGILSKGEIGMTFGDGWQLRTVNGLSDTTEVPVRILQTVKNAISAAGNLEQKRLQLEGSSAGTSNRDMAGGILVGNGIVPVRLLLTRTTLIDPGVYRLQKPAEMHGLGHCGRGLLADLGVPVIEQLTVQVVK